jgi:uncharacterized membrane protein YczE
MNMSKKITILTILVSFISVGVALTLKAEIGVGAWDALLAAISNIIDVPIGTVGMVLNFILIFAQIIILRSNFRKIQLLQFPVSILFGLVINFMFYEVFSMLTLENYVMKLLTLLLGYVIIAFSIAGVMVMDVIFFPVEGFTMAISDTINKKFYIIRQLVDVISVVTALLLVIPFSQPLVVREGTIIGVIIFGPLLGLFMKILKPIFKKFDLIYTQQIES